MRPALPKEQPGLFLPQLARAANSVLFAVKIAVMARVRGSIK
jgi:hypothetical protein